MEEYCLNEFFGQHSKSIRIYLAVETEIDPYEKNVELTELNPIPIKAIISDVSPASAVYKMPGIKTEKVKEIIIKKKYESLLIQSQKIQIEDNFYEGWRINGRLSYRLEGDFLRAYCYIKKV